jgi:hypothetical protein
MSNLSLSINTLLKLIDLSTFNRILSDQMPWPEKKLTAIQIHQIGKDFTDLWRFMVMSGRTTLAYFKIFVYIMLKAPTTLIIAMVYHSNVSTVALTAFHGSFGLVAATREALSHVWPNAYPAATTYDGESSGEILDEMIHPIHWHNQSIAGNCRAKYLLRSPHSFCLSCPARIISDPTT